jgi:hypothetical protein
VRSVIPFKVMLSASRSSLSITPIDAALIDWLLDANEGFGAQLPALQDPDGQWPGGAYFPRASMSAPG